MHYMNYLNCPIENLNSPVETRGKKEREKSVSSSKTYEWINKPRMFGINKWDFKLFFFYRLSHIVSDNKKLKSFFFKYSSTYTSEQKGSNLMACTSNTIIITCHK